MEEIIDGLEVAEESLYAWQAEFLPPDEWINKAFDLFSVTLSWVTQNDFLRLFAVLALIWIVFNLLAFFLRSGKSLSR